jgi:tetratricopeptide (TPR) repeat protein
MTNTFPRNFLHRLLSPEERRAAVVHLWENMEAEFRTAMIQALGNRLGFRPSFIKARPKEWLISELTRQFESYYMKDGWSHIHSHHLQVACSSMVIEILDAEGTPHNGCEIAKGATPPTKEAFLRGIRRVVGRYPDRDVCLYYDLCLSGSSHFNALGEVIQCDELKAAFDRLVRLHPSLAEEVFGKFKKSPSQTKNPVTDHHDEVETGEKAGAVERIAALEGFTVLDQSVIRTIVASAIEAENALSRVQAEALVDELLALCPDRHRSWFHPGFLTALQGSKLSWDDLGSNPERRAWKLAGYLFGRARSQNPNLAGVLTENSRIWKELLEPTARGGRVEVRRALLPLIPALIEESLWKPLSDLLHRAPAPAHSEEMERLYHQILEAAYGLMDACHHEEAVMILNGLQQMGAAMENSSQEWNQVLLLEVMRRLAQAHMRAGRFPVAIPILEQVVSAQKITRRVNPVADLWLAKASLRSMVDFLPTDDVTADRNRFASLGDGPLREAIHSAHELGQDGAHCHIALGLLRFHQQRWQEADKHLSFALCGMMRILGEYCASGLVEQVRFLLGLAIAETGDTGRVHEALVHLSSSISSIAKFPIRTIEAWIRALVLLEQLKPASELAALVIARDASRGWKVVSEAELTRTDENLRIQYAGWIRRRQRAPAELMKCLSLLLPQALAAGAIHETEQLLDDLESLARRNTPCAEKFVAILTQRRDEIASVWDEDSIDLSLAETFESLGRFAESAEVLRRAFFRARHYPSPRIAESFLAGLEQVQVIDNEELNRLRILLQEDSHTNPKPVDESLRGSILFVGGNETQAKYQEDILKRFKEKSPDLKVAFRFPGWSSNWIYDLDDCKRLLPRFDVVVIHRMVRTQFGRSLRSACGSATPWRACTGTGRQSVIAAIEEAARWASRRTA